MNVMSFGRRSGLAIAGVTALLVITGSTALAAPLSSASTAHSTSFAGYEASVTTPVSVVKGTMTVPTVTCPTTGYIDLSSAVHLNGPGSMYTELFFICSNGEIAQQPLLEVGVTGSTASQNGLGYVFVSPGDQLSFSLSGSATKQTLTGVVKDKTTGYSASATGPGSITPVAGTPLSIQAGTTVNGGGPGAATVPAFTPGFTIGSLKIGTSTLAAFSPAKSAVYDGTTLQISTGKISGGGSFTTTFVHS